MALTEIKKQVILMLQSVLSLNSTERTEAMGFLRNCAINFGLEIPGIEEKFDVNKDLIEQISKNNSLPLIKFEKDENVEQKSKNEYPKATINKDLNHKSAEQMLSLNLFKYSFISKEDLSNENKLRSKKPCLIEKKSQNSIKNKNKNKKQSQSNVKSSLGIKINKENEGKKDPESESEEQKTEKSNSKKNLVESKKAQKKLSIVKSKDQKNENEILKCPGCMLTCETKADLFTHFASHPKVPMSCITCRSSFNNVLLFWMHQKKKECKISFFKCSECSEKFKYRRHYLKHVLGHNDNNCRYCDEKFSTWLLYKHHLKAKHPDIKMERDLIPCKFCAMSFRRHLGLYNHYQVEHSKGKFVCLSCGLLLPTKEKYKEHTLVHESEKLWKCKICKMKFYRRQQLLFHVSVHKSGTYKCLTCEITVTSKADLHKHKKEGHEVKGLEPRFQCEICHKSFKKKVVLKNHMATHSKEKEHYCKHCVKSFSTLSALRKHQKRKSHFEKAKIILPESKYEKVYEDKLICESCGKQYKTQRELTWHLRVHKSIYECHECGKTFTLKVNLTKHIKLHRNKVYVVCELCGNTFNQLSALNDHNLMKHSDVRNVECEVCKKTFKRKSELNRHMRIHEQKRPFACFCGTAFKQSSHLQTHYKTFHEKTNNENNLMQAANFTNNESNEMFGESMINRPKSVFVNDEQGTVLPLENLEETNYRNTNSYENMRVNENQNKASYGSNYSLRYPQSELDSMNVSYEELNFEPSQADKRELVFTSPAVDLSMVAISEVVQNTISLGESRDITESVESFNKIPDDAANIQLVNLSEHIVQEYLQNLS